MTIKEAFEMLAKSTKKGMKNPFFVMRGLSKNFSDIAENIEEGGGGGGDLPSWTFDTTYTDNLFHNIPTDAKELYIMIKNNTVSNDEVVPLYIPLDVLSNMASYAYFNNGFYYSSSINAMASVAIHNGQLRCTYSSNGSTVTAKYWVYYR